MSHKKSLDFEINILPILDILSVLICFLLLTAVWMQVGTIDTKQAIGDNTATAGKNPPSLWITVAKDGALTISLRDLPKLAQVENQIQKTSEGINWNALEMKLQTLKKQWPDLKTGIVRPNAQTSYKDVIRLMDQLKASQFEGVGLSPLG